MQTTTTRWRRSLFTWCLFHTLTLSILFKWTGSQTYCYKEPSKEPASSTTKGKRNDSTRRMMRIDPTHTHTKSKKTISFDSLRRRRRDIGINANSYLPCPSFSFSFSYTLEFFFLSWCFFSSPVRRCPRVCLRWHTHATICRLLRSTGRSTSTLNWQ